MADNVLGALFTDIANAIRTKTGGTGKMVPATFPEKILEIPTGGSAGVANIKYASGKVEILEDGSGKITHNLGVVPDIIFVYMNHFGTIELENFAPRVYTLGFSRTFAKSIGATSGGVYSLVNVAVSPATLGSGISNGSFIDNTKVLSETIHNANTMTALVDNEATGEGEYTNDYGLGWGATGGYGFIAIGGLSDGSNSCTVTYMSEDGTEVLYVQEVLYMDDCGDIVAEGLIEKPTKEATETEYYTFNGWTSAVGGEADNALLQDVKDDITVYAAIATTRILAKGQFASGATWRLEEDGTFVASGAGAMDNYSQSQDNNTSPSDCPWNAYASDIKKVTIEDGITTIGNRVFQGCTNLSNISIPNTVLEFGSYAFSNCSSLKTISIPDSVTKFGGYVFMRTALTLCNVPDSVQEVGNGVFYECTSLATVFLPSGWTRMPYAMFYKCALTSSVIPGTVTTIEDFAFSDCTSMTNASIGSNVTSIGKNAFADCTSLGSVVFWDTTTWYRTSTAGATSGGSVISNSDLASASLAAKYLKTTFTNYYWYKL